jgi:nicotinamidase-related amidase
MWQLHPEVEKRPRDVLIDKQLPGAFIGTTLGEWIDQNGIDTVSIAAT